MWCNKCNKDVQVIDGEYCENCYTAIVGAGTSPANNLYDSAPPAGGLEPPTKLYEGGDSTVIYDTPGGGSAAEPKTTYVDPSDIAGGSSDRRMMEGAKLIGWLVSFSHDPRGKDYRIRQGRNSIGSGTENEIVIDYDERVSGRHAVVMFRNDKIKITDDYSQNGTLLNGEDLDGGSPVPLKDKDEIQIGRTKFTLYLID